MEKSRLFCSIENFVLLSCTYDGLAIMGCSDDTLKTIGIRKFGDIAALRGFASQKVFSGGNSSCRESCKKELANAVRTAKFFYKDSKINKKEYARVQMEWKTYNQNEGKLVAVA